MNQLRHTFFHCFTALRIHVSGKKDTEYLLIILIVRIRDLFQINDLVEQIVYRCRIVYRSQLLLDIPVYKFSECRPYSLGLCKIQRLLRCINLEFYFVAVIIIFIFYGCIILLLRTINKVPVLVDKGLSPALREQVYLICNLLLIGFVSLDLLSLCTLCLYIVFAVGKAIVI